MRSRWTIPAALFVARAAFAFQFGSVGALRRSVARVSARVWPIGILIGIYFVPGVLLASSAVEPHQVVPRLVDSGHTRRTVTSDPALSALA